MPRVATAAGATVAALALFVSSTPAAWGVQLERDLTPRYQVSASVMSLDMQMHCETVGRQGHVGVGQAEGSFC